MKFDIKKGNLITILDIGLIVLVFFFAKSYLGKFNKNSTSLTKDRIKYILVINNQKIKKDELLNIRVKVENKDGKKREISFESAVPFNYYIEQNGNLIYKRDLLDSIVRNNKKIYLNKYGKTEFGTEWYGLNLEGKNVDLGEYRLVVYNRDFDIELSLNFEIIQEEK